MESPNDDRIDWRQVRARLDRLEEEHGRLRHRGLLALRLNIVLIIAIAFWLAMPGKALTAERVTAQQVGSINFWSDESGLNRELVRITGRRSQSWLLLGHSGAAMPLLNILADRGRIDAQILGAPSLRLSTRGALAEVSRHTPPIELTLMPDGSPRIVLHDASGQVVWQAP